MHLLHCALTFSRFRFANSSVVFDISLAFLNVEFAGARCLSTCLKCFFKFIYFCVQCVWEHCDSLRFISNAVFPRASNAFCLSWIFLFRTARFIVYCVSHFLFCAQYRQKVKKMFNSSVLNYLIFIDYLLNSLYNIIE